MSSFSIQLFLATPPSFNSWVLPCVVNTREQDEKAERDYAPQERLNRSVSVTTFGIVGLMSPHAAVSCGEANGQRPWTLVSIGLPEP